MERRIFSLGNKKVSFASNDMDNKVMIMIYHEDWINGGFMPTPVFIDLETKEKRDSYMSELDEEYAAKILEVNNISID